LTYRIIKKQIKER